MGPSCSYLIGAGSHFTKASLSMLIMSSHLSESMINNITVAPSTGWFYQLSPFESILLGVVILKLMLLRYVTIFPINLNRISNSDFFEFTNSKKKRSLEKDSCQWSEYDSERKRLAETMFTVVRRLDMQDCFLRTLCEMQMHSLSGNKLPREFQMMISILSRSAWERKRKDAKEEKKIDQDFIKDRDVLSVFEEAVMVAWDSKNLNGTECEEKYSLCSLSKDDIFDHFNTVQVIKVL